MQEGGIKMEEQKTKKCKHCQSDIPKKAKICPVCKKKQGGKLKWVVIVIAAIVVIAIIYAIMSGDSQNTTEGNAGDTNTASSEAASSGDSGDLQNSNSGGYIEGNELEQAYSDPNSYKGKKAKISGKVFGSMEEQNGVAYFQMWHDAENSQDNTIVIAPSNGLKIKEGDYVIVDGVITGTFEGQNAFGGSVSAVSIEATNVEKSDYITVVSPTLKTYKVGSSINQHGYVVTVKKIEFAENETRVYLTVKNNGSSEFDLYTYNAKAVQNGKQYEYRDNYDADYEKVQSDIMTGIKSEGIVTFPAMDSGEDVRLVFEGSSGDWQEEIEPYTFNIEISKSKK